MATTAGKLRAVVTAEVADGVKKLREFGGELDALHRKTETQTDGIAGLFKKLAIGATIIGGIKLAGDVISGVFGAIKNTASEALAAVSNYEQLYYGLRQLTASQIIGAGVTNDMAKALTMAEQPAKELINWVEQLAVKSPFTSDEVAQAFRMAEAFGFNESQAKRLTQAMTDFSAGAGLSGDYINRIMLNMGQMAAAGKVTSREIRDMAMAGLPVKNILADAFGVTQAKMTEMLEDGAVPVGKAFEAIVTFLETRFAGSAARMTETWSGLKSSLEDIKQIDLRELFGGVFEAIRPEAARLVSFLSSDEFRQTLRGIGTALGESVKNGIAVGKEALSKMFDEGSLGGVGEFINKLKSGDFQGAITDIVGAIEFGVMQAAVEIKAVGLTLWQVGSFVVLALKEFIGHLGNLLGSFNQVLNAKVNRIGIELNPLSSQKSIEQAWNVERLALSGLNAEIGLYKAAVGDAYDGMVGKINEINTARDRERATVAEAKAEYYRLAEAKRAADGATGRNTNAGRGTRVNGRYDPRTGKFTPGEPDPLTGVIGDGTFNNFVTTAGDTGDKAGKKMADAMERAIDKMLQGVQQKLQRGMSVSLQLGKMPGLDPLEAGSDGPFEAIYRLQDVAMNLGKPSQGKDTVKWYQQYFGGMGFEDAAKQAAAIVSSFQRGNFTDEVIKYIDLNKLRKLGVDEADAEASQARLAKLVGGDGKFIQSLLGKDVAAAGGVLSPKDAEILAASLKSGVITGLDKIGAEQPTVMQKLLSPGGGEGGAKIDFGGTLVPAIVAAVDAELVANGKALEDKGAAAWALMEKGFIDKAAKSSGFVLAVNAMVDNALKNYLPTN